MIRLFVLLVMGVWATSAWAADDSLKPLSDALVAIRGTHGVNQDRDAGPELTPIKRLLREWVERQLPAASNDNDPVPLERLQSRLNDVLAEAKLVCPQSPSTTCSDRGDIYRDNARGYLGRVNLKYIGDGRYLALQTGIGIRCGFDQSAYVYERHQKSWRLLWQSEQDDYTEKAYAPQNFLDVQASPAAVAWNEPAPPPLILTLGFSPWCSSNWQMLYTRLWRASDANMSPTPLLDSADTLYMGDDGIAAASLTPHDLLVQFRGRSIDGGVLIRNHVRHFLIEPEDKLQRVAPVALDPKDFVDEWLNQPWEESRRWVVAGPKVIALKERHDALHPKTDSDIIFAEFDGQQPTRCRKDRTLWQAQFSQLDEKANSGPTLYFLVRWMAPYHFTMIGTQDKPYAGCDVTVSMPDDFGTLFASPDWRR